MAWLSKLFGGSTAPAPVSETYEGFTVTPQPESDGGGWRIGALIEKGGRQHQLIRADVINDHETAVAASVSKAKQVIDEQGERLFD